MSSLGSTKTAARLGERRRSTHALPETPPVVGTVRPEYNTERTLDLAQHRATIRGARMLFDMYGGNGLRTLLEHESAADLRKMAASVREAHPGTKPEGVSKVALIDYIHDRVTKEQGEATAAEAARRANAPRLAQRDPTEALNARQGRMTAEERRQFNLNLVDTYGRRMQTLIDAARYWAHHSDNAHAIRQAVRDIQAGRTPRNAHEERRSGEFARVLLDAVRHAEPNAPQMYRAIAQKGTLEQAEREYKPGKRIEMNLKSFAATSHEHADYFTDRDEILGHPENDHRFDGMARVTFELESGARALNIAPMMEKDRIHNFGEWISDGTFRVVSASVRQTRVGQDPVLHVRIRQEAPGKGAGERAKSGASKATRTVKAGDEGEIEITPPPATTRRNGGASTRAPKAPNPATRATELHSAYQQARERTAAAVNGTNPMGFHNAYQAEQQAKAERDAFLASLTPAQRTKAAAAIAKAENGGTASAPKRRSRKQVP